MKTKTDAANILLAAGWMFEEIDAVLSPALPPVVIQPQPFPQLPFIWTDVSDTTGRYKLEWPNTPSTTGTWGGKRDSNTNGGE